MLGILSNIAHRIASRRHDFGFRQYSIVGVKRRQFWSNLPNCHSIKARERPPIFQDARVITVVLSYEKGNSYERKKQLTQRQKLLEGYMVIIWYTVQYTCTVLWWSG